MYVCVTKYYDELDRNCVQAGCLSKSRIRVDLRPLVRSLLASREVERKDSGGNHGQEQGVNGCIGKV